MDDQFSIELSSEVIERAELNRGYWVIIKYVTPKDLILVDDAGNELARATQRQGYIGEWWTDQGPQFYISTYAHSITATSAEIEAFSLVLLWKNQGGGTEKQDTVNDHVSCSDNKRRSHWSFSITPEQAKLFRRFEAKLEGSFKWKSCAKLTDNSDSDPKD